VRKGDGRFELALNKTNENIKKQKEDKLFFTAYIYMQFTNSFNNFKKILTCLTTVNQ
jgi:hypothetical protein